MKPGRVLRLDLHIELICPWCQIGLRQLQRARAALLAERPDVRLEVHWHLQTLLPDLPEDGLPFREFYLRRLGSPEALAARQAQVRAAGREAGLEFDFTAIQTMPNTRLAHALLRDAQAQLSAAELECLIERLFTAHFQAGENLGDAELICALAADFGVQCSTSLPVPAPQSEVPGVPFFVFDKLYALSGAQSSGRLLDMMRELLEQEAEVH